MLADFKLKLELELNKSALNLKLEKSTLRELSSSLNSYKQGSEKEEKIKEKKQKLGFKQSDQWR